MHDLSIDWLLLDPSRVLQVFLNLTTNAIKFTKTEAIRSHYGDHKRVPHRTTEYCGQSSLHQPSRHAAQGSIRRKWSWKRDCVFDSHGGRYWKRIGRRREQESIPSILASLSKNIRAIVSSPSFALHGKTFQTYKSLAVARGWGSSSRDSLPKCKAVGSASRRKPEKGVRSCSG